MLPGEASEPSTVETVRRREVLESGTSLLWSHVVCKEATAKHTIPLHTVGEHPRVKSTLSTDCAANSLSPRSDLGTISGLALSEHDYETVQPR